MKGNTGSPKLPMLALLLGMAGLVLRTALYRTAVDVKGLLMQNHPLELALAALTAAVLVAIVLTVRTRRDERDYEDLYAVNLPAAVGNVAAGAGILVTVLGTMPEMGSYLETAWHYLGLAAPACLLLAGITKALGKKPFFLLHVVACLFFLLHIIIHYQIWSSHPQMQDYIFSLLGVMMLMFFSFYTAALEAGCGSPRMMTGMGLAAIYLCSAELARSSCPWLYLGGIAWVLTDLCSMRKVEKK